MTIFDSNLIFSNNQAITASAASTGVIDLQGGLNINAGQAFRTAPYNVFGEDIGIGDGVAIPKIAAFVTTAFAPGTATLQIQAQYAPDTGANEPAGTPGTWVTAAETPATGILGSAMLAGTKVAAFDWPPVQVPGIPLPRYLRLNYVVGTGPFTGGNLFAGLVLQRADNIVGLYPNNFAVGP
jgi:hypothetical protein